MIQEMRGRPLVVPWFGTEGRAAPPGSGVNNVAWAVLVRGVRPPVRTGVPRALQLRASRFAATVS